MVTPNVGLCGTSPRELCNELKAAWRAIGAAMDALKVCMPNGRDYSPDTIETARADMRARIQALDSVRDDLIALARDIQKRNPTTFSS